MERNNRYSAGVRITSILVIILFMGIIDELGARLIFKDQVGSWFGAPALDLDEYEMPDPQRPDSNWLLRPGFSMTLEQAIEVKEESGHVLAVGYLNDCAPKLQIQKGEIILQINQDGFKGPEIDKAHSRLRILTIGDSTTFGTLFDEYSYPRVLERELHRMGIDVEVVNGGVEAYAPRNVLFRIEEFKALRPEVTTIYIGWNALYGENQALEEFKGLEKYFYSIRLVKRAYTNLRVMVAPRQAALMEYNKAKSPDRNAPEVKSLEGYVPSFMGDVEQIVKEMQSVGSRVVLVTLPGLYRMREDPSELALKVGHLPTFTDNPYVLAKMAEQYNITLRELAEQYGLQVIDLEKWSETALQPRDAYFFDSVHLYEEGQEMIGVYMAEEFFPSLSKDNGL